MRKQLSQRRFSLALILGFAIIAGVFFPLQGDELTGPSPKDRRIALIVHSRLKDLHLSQHPLDDEIAGRAMQSLMKRLDPLKLYFLQSDVDEFTAKKNELDPVQNLMVPTLKDSWSLAPVDRTTYPLGILSTDLEPVQFTWHGDSIDLPHGQRFNILRFLECDNLRSYLRPNLFPHGTADPTSHFVPVYRSTCTSTSLVVR